MARNPNITAQHIPQIFNRKLLRLIRNKNSKTIFNTDFLSDYAASLLIEKLAQTNLTFSNILNLGTYSHKLQDFLNKQYPNCDITYANYSLNYLKHINSNNKILCDEELIPISNNSYDLVISLLNLHHINDLPGTLVQIKNILKNKGLFLAVLLGGDTLQTLRTSCLETDSKLGNASPKIAPFIDIKSMGTLLKRANFDMPIIDNQNLILEYQDIDKLFTDIKNIGESNILSKKSNCLMGKKRFNMIKTIYCKKFKNDDIIPANFELINITAFKN